MQRITLLLLFLNLTFQMYAGDKTAFLIKQFTTDNGYQLNYRILYPLDYSPTKSYPVILFLHGAGERGDNNVAQLVHGGDLFSSYEVRKSHDAIIIAPQCPKEDSWLAYSRQTNGHVFDRTPKLTAPLGAAKELIDSYISRGVANPDKIHIMGLSMGGMGTFDFVCRYPNYCVTATPICGGVNLDRVRAYKGKTVFRIYHGGNDTVVKPEYSQDAFQVLKNKGVAVSYKEYPGVGHDSWNNVFAEPDFINWLF